MVFSKKLRLLAILLLFGHAVPSKAVLPGLTSILHNPEVQKFAAVAGTTLVTQGLKAPASIKFMLGIASYYALDSYFNTRKLEQHVTNIGDIVVQNVTELAWYQALKNAYDAKVASLRLELSQAPATATAQKTALTQKIGALVELTDKLCELTTHYIATTRDLAQAKEQARAQGNELNAHIKQQFHQKITAFDVQITENTINAYRIMERELPTRTVILQSELPSTIASENWFAKFRLWLGHIIMPEPKTTADSTVSTSIVTEPASRHIATSNPASSSTAGNSAASTNATNSASRFVKQS